MDGDTGDGVDGGGSLGSSRRRVDAVDRVGTPDEGPSQVRDNRTGRFDRARDWFARARTTLEEEGMRPLRARVDLAEARMYARRRTPGDRQKARDLCSTALAQFERLELDGWAARTRALVHQLDG